MYVICRNSTIPKKAIYENEREKAVLVTSVISIFIDKNLHDAFLRKPLKKKLSFDTLSNISNIKR